jgi:hypothetical protein|tara:strand:- start:1265 stop:2524 length:1260 start_codon:yes stop_codon:yes gene_type:complete
MADFTEGPFVEIGGTQQPSLVTSEGETPRFLYRIVSQQEYDTAQEKGFFSPGGFYGRHHASASPEAQYLEPESNVLLKITHSPEDEWYSKWGGDRVHGVSSKDIPFSRAEKITSGSSQDIRGFLENFKEPRPPDKSKLPAVIDAASVAAEAARLGADESRPKGKGAAFRGLGSLARAPIFRIARLVQEGYNLLPEDYKVIEDWVDRMKETQAHTLFGLPKPGIEYLKEWLGMEQPEPPTSDGVLGRPLYHASTKQDKTLATLQPREGAIWFSVDMADAAEIIGTKGGPSSIVTVRFSPDGKVLDPENGDDRAILLEAMARVESASRFASRPLEEVKTRFERNIAEGESWEDIDNPLLLNALRNDGYDAVMATEGGGQTVAVLNKSALQEIPVGKAVPGKASGGFVDKPLYDDARVGGLI